MTSYGFMMSEVFLELASDNRDVGERVSVRLEYSADTEAFGAWRALQAFMDGNLQTLNFCAGSSVVSEKPEQKGRPSNLKKMAWNVLYLLLGGPLSSWLSSWAFRQRQQTIWRRASSNLGS